jgi:hypothetical protein
MQRVIIKFIFVSIALVLPYIFSPAAIASNESSQPQRSVSDAALKLVHFCNDPGTGLDERAIATLADYVLAPKQDQSHALPESAKCPGAYNESDAKMSFSRFMEYSFNALIPQAVTRPSSVRYSLWRDLRGVVADMPVLWKSAPAAGRPLILHGFQRDSNTPDLTTGVYYTYDLKRTFIMANHQGRPVLISISKQIDRSNVGEKGFILGNDSDWNYYYTGEPGSAKSGLGWVKSYIYDYFSVTVYLESGTAPAKVRTGVFQWIRAGWSGVNFVRPNHIIEGMKRFARNNRMVLESPKLPTPKRIIAARQWLFNLSTGDLENKYSLLQQARRSLALTSGKINAATAGKARPISHIPKEQMIEELMLEFIKVAIGKSTPLASHISPPPSTL